MFRYRYEYVSSGIYDASFSDVRIENIWPRNWAITTKDAGITFLNPSENLCCDRIVGFRTLHDAKYFDIIQFIWQTRFCGSPSSPYHYVHKIGWIPYCNSISIKDFLDSNYKIQAYYGLDLW